MSDEDSGCSRSCSCECGQENTDTYEFSSSEYSSCLKLPKIGKYGINDHALFPANMHISNSKIGNSRANIRKQAANNQPPQYFAKSFIRKVARASSKYSESSQKSFSRKATSNKSVYLKAIFSDAEESDHKSTKIHKRLQECGRYTSSIESEPLTFEKADYAKKLMNLDAMITGSNNSTFSKSKILKERQQMQRQKRSEAKKEECSEKSSQSVVDSNEIMKSKLKPSEKESNTKTIRSFIEERIPKIQEIKKNRQPVNQEEDVSKEDQKSENGTHNDSDVDNKKILENTENLENTGVKKQENVSDDSSMLKNQTNEAQANNNQSTKKSKKKRRKRRVKQKKNASILKKAVEIKEDIDPAGDAANIKEELENKQQEEHQEQAPTMDQHPLENAPDLEESLKKPDTPEEIISTRIKSPDTIDNSHEVESIIPEAEAPRKESTTGRTEASEEKQIVNWFDGEEYDKRINATKIENQNQASVSHIPLSKLDIGTAEIASDKKTSPQSKSDSNNKHKAFKDSKFDWVYMLY